MADFVTVWNNSGGRIPSLLPRTMTLDSRMLVAGRALLGLFSADCCGSSQVPGPPPLSTSLPFLLGTFCFELLQPTEQIDDNCIIDLVDESPHTIPNIYS